MTFRLTIALLLLPLCLTTGCASLMQREHKLLVDCERPDGSGIAGEYNIEEASPEPFQLDPNENVWVSVDKFDPEKRTMTLTVRVDDLPAETIDVKAGESQVVKGSSRRVYVDYYCSSIFY